MLTSTGVMNYLVNLVFKEKRKFMSTNTQKVLTIEDLRFGFVIWFWSCAATVVAFVGEIMIWIAVRKATIKLHKYLRNEWRMIAEIYPVKINK